MIEISALSDTELTEHLHLCVARENESLADVIIALDEFDKRKVYADKAYASLFIYCTKALGFSEDAAFRRIQIARKYREFPSIIERIRCGALSLTVANIIAPHLTSENHRRLIDQASGKSRKEAERLVASAWPKPAAHDVIRSIVIPAVQQEIPIKKDESASNYMPKEFVRIAFTANATFHEKLKCCRDLLSHKYPFGQLDGIFEDAMDALLDKKDLQRCSVRPRIRCSNPFSRTIPRWVRDRVWRRDNGRCGFISEEGRRCESTKFLEFDHVKPWSQGGRSNDLKNIRLLCRTHNQREARRLLGYGNSKSLQRQT